MEFNNLFGPLFSWQIHFSSIISHNSPHHHYTQDTQPFLENTLFLLSWCKTYNLWNISLPLNLKRSIIITSFEAIFAESTGHWHCPRRVHKCYSTPHSLSCPSFLTSNLCISLGQRWRWGDGEGEDLMFVNSKSAPGQWGTLTIKLGEGGVTSKHHRWTLNWHQSSDRKNMVDKNNQ